MKIVQVTFVIAVTCALAFAPAAAGHIRAGLWNVTSTIRFVGVDKIPTFALGKLAEAGVVLPTRPQTAQSMRCITPEAAAVDRLPRVTEDNGACEALNIETTSDGYSGKAICQSYLDGHVWYDVGFSGDTHYEGKIVFKGKMYRIPLETWTNFSAEWSSADCGASATP